MNPMEEKGDDEEDDIGGFTEWLTEDSTETSDEVAELIKDDLWVNPIPHFMEAVRSKLLAYYFGLDDDEKRKFRISHKKIFGASI